MLFPITAFAQAYVQTWDLVDSGKHLDYDGNSTYMSYINTGAATWNAYKSGVIRKDSAFVVEDVYVSDVNGKCKIIRRIVLPQKISHNNQ